MTESIALAHHEQQALRAYESVIQDGLSTFVRVGNCLAIFRDERLYRATHETFESYCAGRWKLTRCRAYQLIGSAEVVGEMSKILDIAPIVESHAAELAKAPPEVRAEAWQEVVHQAPRDAAGRPRVTARQVKAVVERRAQPVKRMEHPIRSDVPAKPVPDVGIDIAVSTLRTALSSAMDSRAREVSEAVRLLRKAAQGHRGWKRSQAPAKAFRGLVEILADLLEDGGHGE